MRLYPILPLLLLAACGEELPPPPPASAPPLAIAQPLTVDRVLGKPAPAVIQLFGKPDLDMMEGPARKLQFASPVCILDAYLYPGENGGIPVVRYIDTRMPGGQDVDKASCIAALSRRAQAR